MLPTVEESRGYDFFEPENMEKWKGLFLNPLKKVLEQVHPSLTAEDSALEYVETLCLKLLAMLCAVPSPLTVQDVEERVNHSFPTPIDKWSVADAREANSSKRKKLQLPVDKIHSLLQKEVLQYKIDTSVSVFMTAILEYISADILKLAGNFVKKIQQKSGLSIVTSGDIKTAMCADKVLMDMFYQEADPPAERSRRASLSYAELVRDLLADERHFLRDLHLIVRVFKDELEKIVDGGESISLIFGNIVDIYELTVTLLGNLEDAMEMSQDSPTPYIGSCFEELAEVEEFRAYSRYANIVTKQESKDALQRIVDNPALAERLDTAGHGFRLAVKYYLPKLVLAPVWHVFAYHQYVLALHVMAPSPDDRESFRQVECNLLPIKNNLANMLGNGPKMEGLRMASRTRRQLAIEKCNELSRLIENWDNRDIGQCCNEFIREDTLSKIGPGKRIAERRAYLFDGLLILCKPITSLVTVNTGAQLLTGSSPSSSTQFKMKEKLYVRKIELMDRPDTDEYRHCVELVPRVGGGVVLCCGSAADKRRWMCDLVMLNTKPMLDRTLDSILLDLERRHPLKLPPPRLYRFAIPDSPDNIVLEDRQGNATAPLIKGATLLKLVERLTYHICADLNLVRTFLTTYRSFCSPRELLDLLIERFRIPDPDVVYDAPNDNAESVPSSDAEKLSKNSTREDWKRYRKEFEQPVKFRVINVLRHWVDQHFYDFERDPALLQQLRDFLNTVDGKPMRKWVQSVLKTMERKQWPSPEPVLTHVFDRPAPALLRHPHDPGRWGWHPLALHPLELARQLTTLEFTLYRQVKPSELVGAVWTKKDKEKTSPNLLRIIKHTTNFTRWMEKWIVESENLEERVGVASRFLELSVSLHSLNNFNAVLAVVAAFGSAAVHRLKNTLQLVQPRLLRALEEFRELNSAHFRRYQERLRSINPPCVPFFGMYLTNILHIEEGNLDYLPNSELINFSKRRKVAEITGEIQQYQNQPYCLTVEPKTRAFLESLEPFPGMDDNEITNYLYAKSLDIEPRPPVKQMPKFPRKYPELSLKSVKVSRRIHEQPATNNDDTVSQLSPTGSNWDGLSVASLPIHSDRGSRWDDRSLTSPRLERSSSNTFTQFSLFDKGFGIFDKGKAQGGSRSSGSGKDEPPSPRDRHSPRHESARSTLERRPQALSPRGAIVDSELFYSRTIDRRHTTASASTTNLSTSASTASFANSANSEPSVEELLPPLLPRGSAPEERPPRAPRRPSSPSDHMTDPPSSSSLPPSPPDRTHSPRHDSARMPAISPKRSPAPQPPVSPLVTADRLLFSFPSGPSSTPSPQHGHSPSAAGTPPPLPPRRRRDSTAPHTPLPPSSSPPRPPPPLPPRPPPAPELLRPAHSTILQRRHLSSNIAPELPPKPPPPPAVAPRT